VFFIQALNLFGFMSLLVSLHRLIASSGHRITELEKQRYLFIFSRGITATGFTWWGSSLLQSEFGISFIFLALGVIGAFNMEKDRSKIEELEKQQRFKPAPNKESQP
jgi:hypothetical protein